LPFNESELMDFWNQPFESVMIALLRVKSAAGCSGTKSRAKIYECDQISNTRMDGVTLLEATAMLDIGCRVAAYLNKALVSDADASALCASFSAPQRER
jgi:hypothetical protein